MNTYTCKKNRDFENGTETVVGVSFGLQIKMKLNATEWN